MSIPTTPPPSATTRVATQLAGVSAERGQALVEPGGHVFSDLLESTVDKIIIVEQPLCCLAGFRGRINTSKTSMAQPIGNRLNALDEN